MKKFVLFIGIFALSNTFSSFAFAGSFPDVSEEHENYAAIEYLKEHLVIDGYENGDFGPENTVNRAEAAKIIIGAFGIGYDGEYEEKFSDVTAEDWFFPYVMGGHEAEVIHGHDDGTFLPGDVVNLAETLKMSVAASGVEISNDVSEDVFADVSKNEWYAPYAYYARENNIILPDGNFNLDAGIPMTRAAFAEVIYRMMVVLESGKTFPLSEGWTLYESSIFPFKMEYNDDEWGVIESETGITFYRSDPDYEEAFPDFPERVYSNSGLVRVSVSEHSGMTKDEYFTMLREVFEGAQFTEFKWGGFDGIEVLYSEARIVDWHIYLDGTYRMTVVTEYGDGNYGYILNKTIKEMLGSLQYNSSVEIGGNDYSSILSEIFSNILVEGKGEEMLGKLPDSILIETDAIGVGTGPVDYYYSSAVNYTFKHERASDVILDKREGRTTAF